MHQTRDRMTTHDEIVSALVRYFEGKGWSVYAAACLGYPDADKIGRHEPDALARDAQRVIIIGEAKTGDGDLAMQHSRQQYEDFSSRVMTETGARCPFYICVPKHAEAQLRVVLREEGVLHKPNVHILTFG